MAKEFPLRVTRRADISTGKAWLVRLCAILLALLTGVCSWPSSATILWPSTGR